ncbi:venom peptide isomerase heavy chain-like [Oppia nitens]|uniref:venom peptide isomerase heavy chain-like n=1 Tax=Oppia nitens TaxID=1686743 RepID=UPI0023DB3B53|nr:venom peptide isomerase heavy chain-like [Oppia nitens]
MNIHTMFCQLLAYLGITCNNESPSHPIVNPQTVGPYIRPTNGPIRPLLNNGQNWADNCGLPINGSQPKFLETKIVGGGVVNINNYPWQVSLQRRTTYGFYHFCGASLIHPQYILTAAHCLQWGVRHSRLRPDARERLRVLAGVESASDVSKGLFMRVVDAIIHREFVNKTGKNDIALIRLEKPILLMKNRSINTICLPKPNEPLNRQLIVTGWGTTAEDGEASLDLKAVMVPLVSSRDCVSVYGRQLAPRVEICAGSEGKDACQGDSGGPLLQMDRNGRASQVGIVSEGHGCARKGFPGIYTRVEAFLGWIRDAMLVI